MIDTDLKVDERAVLLRLEQLPVTLRERLVPHVTDLTSRLLARVHALEPVRTGKLRAETQMFVDVAENAVRGRVRVLATGSEHGKAAAFEYGAHNVTRVQAHQATLTEAFGRAIEPRTLAVDAYSRRLNITERRFERGPLEEMRPEILAELETAVGEAVR